MAQPEHPLEFLEILHVFHDFSACHAKAGPMIFLDSSLPELPDEALQAFVGPGIPASRLTGDQDGIYVSHGPVVSKAGLWRPCDTVKLKASRPRPYPQETSSDRI